MRIGLVDFNLTKRPTMDCGMEFGLFDAVEIQWLVTRGRNHVGCRNVILIASPGFVSVSYLVSRVYEMLIVF